MHLLSVLRCTAALPVVRLALLGLATAGVVTACGTDADGVSQCRTIEAARCRAAAACGLVADVDACLRYTRDHCLHGTATGGTPNPNDVKDCVDLLDTAGSCAAESPERLAKNCPGVDLVAGVPINTTDVCEVIVEPEKAKECSFLMAIEVDEEEPTPTEEDAGGDGG